MPRKKPFYTHTEYVKPGTLPDAHYVIIGKSVEHKEGDKLQAMPVRTWNKLHRTFRNNPPPECNVWGSWRVYQVDGHILRLEAF